MWIHPSWCHSKKERVTPARERAFGYHPIFSFPGNTREALAAILG
jgi:hypothetical protein